MEDWGGVAEEGFEGAGFEAETAVGVEKAETEADYLEGGVVEEREAV